MELLISKTGFAILAILAIAPWLVAAYWHLQLMKRLHIVACEIYSVPENIPWNRRAAKAKSSDPKAQVLAKKRNIYAFAFIFVVLIEAVLLGIATCINGACI